MTEATQPAAPGWGQTLKMSRQLVGDPTFDLDDFLMTNFTYAMAGVKRAIIGPVQFEYLGIEEGAVCIRATAATLPTVLVRRPHE